MLSRLPSLPARMVLAIAGGVVLGLAYEPTSIPWLVLAAIPMLLIALKGTSVKGGFVVGAVFGITWYIVLVPWLKVIGGDAAIALAVLEGLFYGVFGALASPVLRIRGWQLWVPALWVATEYATASVPFGGFPWGRLAWAFAGAEPGHYAAWFGIPGLSFLLALCGTLLYSAVRRRTSVPRRVAPVALVAVVLAVAYAVPTPDTDSGRDVTVAMVQGNVPGKGMDFLGEARTVTRNHLAATQQLAADVTAGRQPRPELVIWPENSTDIDPFKDDETRADIETAVAAVGVPILVGAVLEGPGPNERQTTGVVWDPRTGPGQIYAKRHPVPFGEYIPFRDQLLPYIHRLEQVGRQTAPGKVPGVVPIGGVTYGDVICFEIAYDDVVADVMNGGAQVLVVQTNNATYAGTGQPDQQFAITRMRAIETGRTVLVASTNGISGVIHPDGRIEHKSAQGVRDVYVATVPVRDGTTMATRLGGWPQWILTALGLLAAVVALVRRRRQRSTGEPPAATDNGTGDQPDGSGSAGEREPVTAGRVSTGEADR